METSTSTTLQPGSLDARHLDAQLSSDFRQADEETIDAVMQLAAFTEQQSHHRNLNNSHSDSVAEEDDGKNGRKRKADHAEEKANKTSKEEDHHQNWAASFANHSNEFEQLMHQAEGAAGGAAAASAAAGQQQQQANESQQEGDLSTATQGDVLTKHGRPLSNTKRAAQNRAAQRAFRERRDQHFKEIEAKARQVDEALSSASMHKQRYDDLLKTIAGLRADNQSLRLAISALGGNASPPPIIPQSFSSLDVHQHQGSNEHTNGYIAPPPPPSALQDMQHTGDRSNVVEEEAVNQSNSTGNHLDGLSAVAVAAAAAAHAVVQEGGDNEASKDGK